MSGPLCRCRPPRNCTRKVSRSEANPGRAFWSCSECNFFEWEDSKRTRLTEAGPNCKCGQPSLKKISKTADNPNRPFWACASTAANRCRLFEWAGEAEADPGTAQPEHVPTAKRRTFACKKCDRPVDHKVVKKDGPNKGRTFYKCGQCQHYEFLTAGAPPDEEMPGSIEYLVDEGTRRDLQALFHVPSGAQLGWGRDYKEKQPSYDYLRVECAWKVKNPTKSKRYHEFVAASGSVASGGPTLREDFARAGRVLHDRMVSLAEQTGGAWSSSSDSSSWCSVGLTNPCERFMIHGTKPESLYPILFQGLDPGLATDGLFGKGTYFAEDAAKIDQYLAVDKEWQARDNEHELSKLHRKLYENNVKHAGDVFYALVCSVFFDSQPLLTKDGEKTIGRNRSLWLDEAQRDTLVSGKHSLVAELGGSITRFREFVIFTPNAIKIEYLVALKRTKRYCEQCGQPAMEKEVTKNTQNKGRPILVCDQCSWIQMLPLCHCTRRDGKPMSAEVATTKTGKRYYRCGASRDFCDFKDWNGPA